MLSYSLLLTLHMLCMFVGWSLWMPNGITDSSTREDREPEDLRPAIKNSVPEIAQVTCTHHIMARNNSHTQLQKKKKMGKCNVLTSLKRRKLYANISRFSHNYCCCCRQVASVMSDSVRPHRWQPTRLPHPSDSPGKNTGVGCHFLLQCMKVKSESEVAKSCPTQCDPTDGSPPGSSIHGILQARVPEWGAIAFSSNS